MDPSIKFTKDEAIKILNQIPEEWYNVYSKLEACAYPQIGANPLSSEFVKQHDSGYLILLERLRIFSQKLQDVCNDLESRVQGKNVLLPTGESLGDLIDLLQGIKKYQISVLRQYVLLNPEYQTPLDEIFIYSYLQEID